MWMKKQPMKPLVSSIVFLGKIIEQYSKLIKVTQPMAKEIWILLTGCVTSFISNCQFPGGLEIANVIKTFKKDSPFNKANYHPISRLPSLSKDYEKIVCRPCKSFREKKLSLLFLVLVQVTQHPLLILTDKWQNWFNKAGVEITVLMEFFKACDYLPYDFILPTAWI